MECQLWEDIGVLQLRVVSRVACAGPCGRTTVKSRAVRRVWVVRAPDSASVCVYLFNKQSRGAFKCDVRSARENEHVQ